MVALADQEPFLGDFEQRMLNMKTTARKELVLLHSQRHPNAGCVRDWVSGRPWIQAHHHVR